MDTSKLKKVYLAIPYSGIEDSSYLQATEATAKLMSMYHVNIFSPITHSHPLYKEFNFSGDWNFWEKIDYQFIDWCDEMWIIIPCEGSSLVTKSTGVNAEKKYALANNKSVKYITMKKIRSDYEKFSKE